MNTTRILLLSGLTFAVATLTAQAPQAFSYQAVARDVDGDAIAGEALEVQFLLHHISALGTVVYSETHSTTTNDHGLFTLRVGEGTPGTGTFSAIDWRSDPRYFLDVQVNRDGAGYISMGTQQLLSVPYALHAGSSSNVPNGTEVGQIMHWDGGAWVAEDGIYVHQQRFGIGITEPASPLGIAADTTNGSAITIYQASSSTGPGPFNPLAWNINLNPSNSDVAGFSIDDATSGLSTSRLFIADSSGNVGIGTTEPEAPLSVQADPSGKLFSVTGQPTPVGETSEKYHVVMMEGGSSTGLSIDQDTVGGSASRLFIQSGTGHIGIGTQDPPAPLALVSRNVLKQYFQTGDFPTQSQFGFTLTDTTGFGIDQGIPGSMTSRLFIQSSSGNVGIGTNEPEAPLHLVSRDELRTKFENGDIPTENDFSFRTSGDPANPGFSMEEESSLGHVSRLFIQETSGFIGLGTLQPQDKVHLRHTQFEGGGTGLRIQNTATAANEGFSMNHLQDPLASRDGAFTITEDIGSSKVERITVLPGGRVGINELLPDVKLHVSRPLADPSAALDLIEGTGIMVVGPMTDNIVADYRGLQARHGEYVGGGSTLSMTASELNLQRLGGNILIHGDDAVLENQVSVTGDGRIGVGTLTPTEKLDVNGAIRIRDTDSAPEDGTIRYSGTDFEGRKGGAWVSLTNPSSGPWTYGTGTPDRIYFAPAGNPRVGIGTTEPTAQLSLRGTSGGLGAVVTGMENASTNVNRGWALGHLHDPSTERDGAFCLFEDLWPDAGDLDFNDAKLVVLPGGNVGINEGIPDTKLHVSRDLAEPGAALDLIEGTGIMVVGPMTDNIAFDYQGIQARTGIQVAGSWDVSATTLQLQRRGGGLILHESAGTTSARVEVTPDGKLGLGMINPVEKIEVDGAIKIGTTITENEGTIRFTGTDFEGFAGGEWVPMSTWRRVISSNDIHHNAKVGIGIAAPAATLHVDAWAAVVERSTGALFNNSATTSSSSPNDNRVCLQITNTGTWGGDPGSKNIGLYVSEVSGQSSSSSNLAAVLNGNTVIGGVTGDQMVGTNGTNVLAIQNGTAPTTALSGGPGGNGAVQLYSADDATGTPTLHVMRANGEVVKLYKESALTAANPTSLPGTYDASVEEVINNLRTRINELEARLQAIGLLANP